MRPTIFRTALLTALLLAAVPLRAEPVQVEIVEGISDKKGWDFTPPEPVLRYTESAFGFVGVPAKYSPKGIVVDRSNPFMIRATARLTVAAGEYRVLLRSRGGARLAVDGKTIAEIDFLKANANGHEKVPDAPSARVAGLCVLPVGHQEKIVALKLDGAAHEFRLEAFIGGPKLRADAGEILVGVARQDEPFRLLGSEAEIGLTTDAWADYVDAARARLFERNESARRAVAASELPYWNARHELARKEGAKRPALPLPKLKTTTPVDSTIDRFIMAKLEAAKVTPAPLTDDYAFLRRVTLDTIGVLPMRAEIAAFRADKRPDRRRRVIDRLLADPRWADQWVGYWQDVLAENPGILKPMLNNTGPFRWWLHQVFRDNLPMDRFVTELVMMEGSVLGGGPGGFGMASENDAPMAAKADILARAFLGVELQCARCHDAPYHPYKQRDLFNLAALLDRKTVTLPVASTVPLLEGGRKPGVPITLKPGDKIEPAWPFADLAPADLPATILRDTKNPRERLAAILTSPRNERFAQVIVNRLWKRLMGVGIVEPVDDWNNATPSHPELLDMLARELVAHDYDLKHVARLILNSHTYQRAVRPDGARPVEAEKRLFASAARRRLSAEQLVDSLFAASGKDMGCEELTMDPEGRRSPSEMLNLGRPRRAWEFTSLSNERDRPALALPVAQSIVDLLTTFGWRDSRQNPLTVREESPTPLQPLLLANGVVGSRAVRLSDDSAFTALCLEDRPLPELIDAVFLQTLSRPSSAAERTLFVELLEDGYDDRKVPGAKPAPRRRPGATSAVSWGNHLSPEATKIKMELERLVRAGDPSTNRLKTIWRERMEDMLWTLLNAPEFVFVP